jgi:endoglucanase
MNKKKQLLIALAVLLYLLPSALFGQNSIVDKYGQLSVKGNYLFGQNGDTVQLRGMSLFWSQWMGQYYNADAIKWLKDDWKCTVVRAAMGVDMGGYAEHPEEEKAKVIAVVDAAIANGIYVIIDYHSHEAHKNPELAKTFFSEMALKYGKYPNVIYEIYNEPLQNISWSADIKPYSEAVIKAIRAQDPDNIVICGTRQWSQLVNEAALDPIKETNIVYSLHFYAATHRKWLRDEAMKAMGNGVCIFVSEYGTCDASGNSRFDPEHTKEWFDFMDKYKISSCNWSIADKVETASALTPGASGKGGWTSEQITPSGNLVKAEIAKNAVLLKKSKPAKKAKTKK